MFVFDSHEIVNEALAQVTGEHLVLEQDYSNLTEVGNSILNSGSFDNFMKALPDVVGKIYFTSTKYQGLALNIMRESWEFGAALMRISSEMPVAVTNEVWELEDGVSYDPNVFHKPTVTAKYWQKRNSFDIEISIAKDQVKSALFNIAELDSLIGELFIQVDNAITEALDNLSLSVLQTGMAYTISDEFASGNYGDASGVRAINLLKEYNDQYPNDTLTTSTCVVSESFYRFAATRMLEVSRYIQKMSVLYNLGGKKKFTPSERLNFIMLDKFEASFNNYLKSNVFHEELIKLPKYSTIPYWQGIGTDGGFASRSKINVKHDDVDVELSGIIGVMFDDRTLMVNNERQEIDTNYNGKARFFNYFYHVFNGLLIDMDFPMVVFFIADHS